MQDPPPVDAPDTPTPSPRPVDAAPRPAARAPFWIYALPVLSLVVTLGLWYQTRQEVASLTRAQRQLSADLDEARGLATINVAGAPARGPADQVLTLIEFSDYECPFCIRHFSQTMPQIEEQYIKTGRLRYVFKDFPIDQLHPGAIRGHEAARCANEQGKFWEMHTRMFTPPGSHTDPLLQVTAGQAGLAIEPFQQCLTSGRTTADVRKTVQMAVDLGANGTPAFFIGLRDPRTDEVRVVTRVSGAQPFSAFDKAFTEIETKLREG